MMEGLKNAKDFDRIRRETPGTTSFNGEMCHFNNAGCSLPTQRTMDATVAHLRREFLFGGWVDDDAFWFLFLIVQ